MDRLIVGIIVMIGAVAGFLMVASSGASSEIEALAAIVAISTFLTGLAIAIGTGEHASAAGRTGDVTVNIHGQGQPMQYQQQPQVVYMPAPQQHAGMAPHEVHGLISQQMRAFQAEHAQALHYDRENMRQLEYQRQMEHQQQMVALADRARHYAALEARHSPAQIDATYLDRGRLTSSPQRALAKPSIAGTALKAIGRPLKRLVT